MCEETDSDPDVLHQSGALFRISTDVVPERERLGFWEELLSTAFIPVRLKALDNGPFHCEAISFCTTQLSSTQILGTPQINNVRPGDGGGEQFLLAMPQNGSSMSYGGCRGELLVRSGNIMVVGPAAKGPVGLLGTRECDVLVWTVPRRALEGLGIDTPDAVRAVSSENGVGTLIAMYMRHMPNRMPGLDPLAKELLDRQFTQMTALAIGSGSDLIDLGRESVREAQLNRVLGYISSHLFEPHLTPASVADALGLSVRYIHLLLQPKGITFSEWVRERRIAEAYRILTSAAGNNQSVSNVAYACGFPNLSAFYRWFRARYGMTPRDAQQLRRDKRL